MRKKLISTAMFCTLLLCSFLSFGQKNSGERPWRFVSESAVPSGGERRIVPEKYKIAVLDLQGLKSLYAQAPLESQTAIGMLIELPKPDGTYERFQLTEYYMMEEGLRMQFPEIKTYQVSGVDDPTATGKLDFTPQGFHGMVLSANGTYFIDPYHTATTAYYLVYNKKDFIARNKVFSCGVHANIQDGFIRQNPNGLPIDLNSNPTGAPKTLIGTCSKKTYRLALAATGEYTTFQGGTVALAQAAQVTTMNRVNGVYEREMTVRLNIIANNSSLIYTNASTDPYTNGTPGTMINQNQTNTTSVIGSANYDIGHVFGTNSGGLAGLGVTCSSSLKANGVTGSAAPVGDPFDIDYVAHEMGHQFGANHTFNNSCGGNRNNTTAWETGSGSTIMGYAGICAPDVQSNSDDYFHAGSLVEIASVISSNITAGCPTVTSLSNSAPSITSTSGNKTIPKSTPFVLTATGTDANNSTGLTYCWEQMDNAVSTQAPVATSTTGPNFRSRAPSTNGSRYFPRLQDLASNATTTWEVLSSVGRTFSFRCAMRDNNTGGGCVDYSNVTVTVDGTSGPFVVTYPTNTGVTANALGNLNVTWNVAGTTAAPVSCANVDIFLSTDGGLSFPTSLGTFTNNGSATVTLPNVQSTTARIMVKGNGNIFFDISNNNFTIAAPLNDFTFTSSASNDTICLNTASASYPLNLTAVGNFNSTVTFSASGLPSGASASFSPTSLNPVNTQSATLTLNGLGSLSTGVYTFTATATSGANVKNLTLTLTILSTPAPVTLTSPANNSTTSSTSPTFTWNSLSNALNYTITVATDSFFNNVVATAVTTSTSYSLSNSLSANTMYFWRVVATNYCGGTAFTRFRFTTPNIVCKNYTSTNVPLAISASGTPTVNSTLTSIHLGTITSVSVNSIVGTHSYINDLRFTLKSPANTSVILMNQVCGAEANFNLGFSNTAANTYASIPCPPTSGLQYVPNQSLAAFNGQQVNGTWTLTVNDLANVDGGTLTGWSINVCYQPTCNLAITATPTVETCPGNCNGSVATATSSFIGTPAYVWSNGSTSASLQNQCRGSYTVSVTDDNGCSATSSATVGSGTRPVLGLGVTNESCFGSCNGAVTLTNSASGTFTYQWSNGATTQNISGLCAGSYSITSTHTSGCATSTTVTINAGTSPILTLTPTAESCAGSCNGSIALSNTGNGGPFTYMWSNGATSSAPSSLCAGNYTVTSTNSFGCTASASTSVAAGGAPATVSAGSNQTICSTAAATLSGSIGGGASSATWSSSGDGTFSSSTALNATYTPGTNDRSNGSVVLTLTTNDPAGGCNAASAQTTITLITCSSITGLDTICSGTNRTYSITAVAGATAYTWSATPSTGVTISGTSGTTKTVKINTAGTYTLSVVPTINGAPGSALTKTIRVITSPTGGTITGPTTVCQGAQQAYTFTNPVNATSAVWSVSNGGSVVSSSLSGATLQFSNNASQIISVVTYNGSCPILTSRKLTVSTTTPPTGGTLTGPTVACQGNSLSYTVSGFGNRTTTTRSFLWTTTNGATVTGTDSTVSINFNNAGTSNVQVRVGNGGCYGNPLSQNVAVSTAPTGTFTFSGVTTACEGQTKTYTATASSGVTYTWSVIPSNAATIVSGQGTNVANIQYNGTYTSGTTSMSVQVVPSIGTCAASAVSKTVNVYKYPVGTAVITNSADSACTGAVVNTSVTPLTFATTYAWMISGAASVGTSTTSTNSFTMGTANVVVKVQPKNLSCSSPQVQKTVFLKSCVARMELPGENAFKLYPNPADDLVYLQLNESGWSGVFEVSVMNTAGIELMSMNDLELEAGESVQLDVQHLPAGIYLVAVKGMGETRHLRLVKQSK